MKFYAFIPTKEGTEPMGTAQRYIFNAKSGVHAINKTRQYCRVNHLKDYNERGFKLYTYKEFYNDSTFTEVHTEKPQIHETH